MKTFPFPTLYYYFVCVQGKDEKLKKNSETAFNIAIKIKKRE